MGNNTQDKGGISEGYFAGTKRGTVSKRDPMDAIKGLFGGGKKTSAAPKHTVAGMGYTANKDGTFSKTKPKPKPKAPPKKLKPKNPPMRGQKNGKKT
jgi:hypothetical protein